MKKIFITALLAMLTMGASGQDAMKKQKDGTYVVNTTTLCKARGYKSYTPLEVHIKSGKVEKITPLANQETPKYLQRCIDGFLSKFLGKKVRAALGMTVEPDLDACTGATKTAKALNQNVKSALDYYNKKK